MAIQPDGDVVVAGGTAGGDVIVLRYTPAGALDPTFDGDGIVTTDLGSTGDSGSGVAIQADGKIVVAATTKVGTNTVFAAVRYTPTGALDPTLGGDGIVTTVITNRAYSTAIALQTDGKIVVVGYTKQGTNRDFAAVRYTTTGALDPTFDGDGIVTTDLGSPYEDAYGVAIDGGGRIVIAGSSHDGTSYVVAVVRYTATGALDPTFDGDGIVTTGLGMPASALAVAVGSNGRPVVAGSVSDGPGSDLMAVIRHTFAGALDPTFDGDGVVTTAIGSSAGAMSVAVQGDGRIVVAGKSYNGADDDFARARYSRKGALDPTFGGDGTVTTQIGPGDDIATELAIQSDGKIVVAGLRLGRPLQRHRRSPVPGDAHRLIFPP